MSVVGRWLKWAALGLVGLFLVWQLWLLGWVLFWGRDYFLYLFYHCNFLFCDDKASIIQNYYESISN